MLCTLFCIRHNCVIFILLSNGTHLNLLWNLFLKKVKALFNGVNQIRKKHHYIIRNYCKRQIVTMQKYLRCLLREKNRKKTKKNEEDSSRTGRIWIPADDVSYCLLAAFSILRIGWEHAHGSWVAENNCHAVLGFCDRSCTEPIFDRFWFLVQLVFLLLFFYRSWLMCAVHSVLGNFY